MTSSSTRGVVIWLTGISGAGKSTLGRALVEKLVEQGTRTELLDGDIVRDFFENDLGYSRAERIMNIKRITFAARLLSDHGVSPVVANIAPYFEARDFIRRKLPRYLQIYVKASLAKVQERDVRGHYKNFKNGTVTQLIGVDDRYDEPRNPDVVVDTDQETIAQSLAKIWAKLQEKGVAG